MVSRDNIADKLAVRIAINDGKNLIGSGVIFIREKESPIFILTAAHVAKKILQQTNQKVDIHINCKSPSGQQEVIKATVSEASKNDDFMTINKVYIHKKYDDIKLHYDVAIIVLPWKEWMSGIESFQMGKFETKEEAIGYGFPISMDSEYDIDNTLAGKKFIEGHLVFDGLEKGIRYSYKQEGPFDFKCKREDIVNGYSGSGLFVERECGTVFMGVISQGAGEKETAGSELWAASTNMFLELLEMYNVKLEPPKSFKIYIDMAIEEISWNTQATRFFKDCCYSLINDNDITPLSMHKNTKAFERFLCNGNRNYCDVYITGQLKKAVIFSVLDISLDNNEHNMTLPYEEGKVNVEYLCTEEKYYCFIGSLVEKGYFKEERYLNKPTFFICNGKGENSKIGFSRRQCQTMIPNIADEINSKYEIREKFGIDELVSSEFDIIKGKLSRCNLCFIGVDNLINRIENDSKIVAKSKMEEGIGVIWKI